MSQYEDLLIDALLDDGFTLDEAMRLIKLQERTDSDRTTQTRERRYDLWHDADIVNNWN